MGLTLFEVSAITSLFPHGDVIHHYSKPQRIFNVLKGASTSLGDPIDFRPEERLKLIHLVQVVEEPNDGI